MKKIIAAVAIAASLSGCQLSLDGLASTATATGGALLGSAIGGPLAGAAVGIGAGVVTDAITPPASNSLSSIPKEQRADVAKYNSMWKAIENLGLWAILAVLGFFLVPLLIGYFLPNGKQRKMEKEMFNHPDFKR